MREAAARPSDADGWSGWRLPVLLIAAVTLWRLVCAAMVPVTQDEAYYFDWARHLAWGYFDHPPGVALIGIGTWLAPTSTLAARLGAVIAGGLTLLVLWRFYLRCGLSARHDAPLALLLVAATPPGLISGVITTPDTVLALCWALALHEAAAALDPDAGGDRRRWLTAGLATGLGLLGKYTMGLIGPVFLWALFRADPRALRTPWPYVGGLVALLVFLPNILWNAQHDWLTMRFQLGHGFSADTGEVQLATDVLLPEAGLAGGAGAGPEPPMAFTDRVGSLAAYLGTQLAFWGLLLFPLGAGLLSHGGLRRFRADLAAALSPAGRALLIGGTAVPLGLFALVSLVSPVEANWSAVYLSAAAGLLAIVARPLVGWVIAAAGLNLLLVTLYAAHAATGALPLPNAAKRILRETHGFDALAAHVADLPRPLFADRYQTVAMLNFYHPGIDATQWPGIARPSEYLGGRIARIPSMAELRQTGFSLVTNRFIAPSVPGFLVVETQTLLDCDQSPRQVGEDAGGLATAQCDKPRHAWRVYVYRPDRRSAVH